MESRKDPVFTGTLPPVRGIVPVHNRKGRSFAHRDIHRWIRLLCGVHKVQKIDLLVHDDLPPDFGRLIALGQRGPQAPFKDGLPIIGVPLSLRTNMEHPPDNFGELVELGLFDVFLTVTGVPVEAIGQWGDSCSAHGRALRLQLQPPFPADVDGPAVADAIAQHHVAVLNLSLDDPFVASTHGNAPADLDRSIGAINALATACRERGIETNIIGVPHCLLDAPNRELAGGMNRFFLDHQQYHRSAYALAAHLYRRSPRIVRLCLAAMLAHHAELKAPGDAFILRWLVMGNHAKIHAALNVISRFAREYRLLPRTKQAVEAPEENYLDRLEKELERSYRVKSPRACEACAYRLVCDKDTSAVRSMVTAFQPRPIEGDPIPSPRVLLQGQHKHFDAVDTERLHEDEDLLELAREANRVMADSPPDLEFEFDDIHPVNAYHHRMPGAYRYLSLTDRELISTYLYWEEPPFTVAVTFGGGLADYIGFTVNETIRIVCPMEACSHHVALHCDEDGRYVLLRDGQPVHPAALEGLYHLPRRLPSVAHVRLCMRNVDGRICTHNPVAWRGKRTHTISAERVRFSVVVVCTRYARRLQAALQSIAHQEGVDPEAIEIIVGYVPAIDATDDLITSIQLAHPRVRILRSPFAEHQTTAKGAIINQSVALASGEWVAILDADIILAPRFLTTLETVDDSCMFAAPKGRKMMPKDLTAQILLGETRPWECWDALIAGPGDSRWGKKREGGEVPVGFCQLVRRKCFETVRYNEYGHFEGADYEFGLDMIEQYGPCQWLDVPVLHLDHGGSQWYGARSHL